MPEEQKSSSSTTAGQSAETALDTLNAELKAKRNPPKARRRRMEAIIEKESRQRRSSEAPVSSKLKSSG